MSKEDKRPELSFRQTLFGDQLEYPMPPGATAVIVAVDRQQHCPVQLCLPHQVYRESLLFLLNQYPDAKSITIFPVINAQKVEVPLDLINAKAPNP